MFFHYLNRMTRQLRLGYTPERSFLGIVIPALKHCIVQVLQSLLSHHGWVSVVNHL